MRALQKSHVGQLHSNELPRTERIKISNEHDCN